MCGIIGYCGNKSALSVVLEGLARLEYRGYDSAGLAFLQSQKLEIIKAQGKLVCLEKKLKDMPTNRMNISIGHTRWATHGLPVEKNAHPHKSQNSALAIVHNGIIENFQEIKKELLDLGYTFTSDTDTEVLANLIAYELDILLVAEYGHKAEFLYSSEKYLHTAQENNSYYLEIIEKAFCNAIKKAHGAYAVVMLSPLTPQHIYATRLSAPLLIGLGEDEVFVASDIPAFLPYTRKVIFLDDEDVAVLNTKSCTIKSLHTNKEQTKEIHHITWDLQGANKDGYKHFMLKEIMEQPKVLQDCLVGREQNGNILLPELDSLNIPKSIKILACGTSYNAGLLAQKYFESLANIPVTVEIASEFRYRSPVLREDELILVISQSGETADTLGALRLCKELKKTVLGVCNVLGSSVAREADITLYTQAGPEISVASTKALLSQMVLLLLMAIYFGQRKKSIKETKQRLLLKELKSLPSTLTNILPSLQEKAKEFAQKYAFAKSFFYLGRGSAYPLSLEGALKLKELAYIHAEGYPLGELKHGPLALIEPDFPSFVTVFDDEHFPKVKSGILEVQSRQGKVLALVESGCDINCEDIWSFPKSLLPELLALPALQLFSYEMASYLDKDVDQPRNLAKSVTVE